MILRRGPATEWNSAARPVLWRGWLSRSPNAEGDTPAQPTQRLLLALSAAVAPCNVEVAR